MLIFLLFYLFIFIFIDQNFIDVFISPYNVKGNIWLLVHANEDVDWPAMGTYETYIVKFGDKLIAIEELNKCVDKYTRKNKPAIVERCQNVLDQLK